LQCSSEQGIEDLLGSMTLRGGETVFAPGPIPRALSEGAILCLDEIDMRNPAHDSIYHSALDNSELASVTLPTGETVKAADGLMIIATMNGTPDDLPLALLRRFDVLLNVPAPHPDALAGLPEPHRRAINAWTASAKAPDYAGPRSVSAFRSFARLTAAGVDEVQAATLIFGPKQGREVLAVIAQNA
jgi:MoxR-like ATPase